MREERCVGVVEPNSIFLEGLTNILIRAGFRVSFCATTLNEAIERGTNSGTELLLFTIPAAGFESYVEEAAQIRARFPGAKLVALAEAPTRDQVQQIWPFVDGLILRTIGAEALVKALELVLLGERVIPSIPTAPPFGSTRDQWQPMASPPPDRAQLSPREVDVLRALSAGHANKIIARQIGISEATVKVHMKAILRKLKAKNRTEAAVWARNHGLAPQPREGVATSTVSVRNEVARPGSADDSRTRPLPWPPLAA